MTIKYPKGFKDATPAGFDGIFDWDFLLPVFKGTKIEPMDIDGIVERHGQILLFETKAPGNEIKKGQEITLKALLKIGKGTIHLIVIYGKTVETIIGIEEWYWVKGCVEIKKTPCDARGVFQRVSAWFNWANGDSDATS